MGNRKYVGGWGQRWAGMGIGMEIWGMGPGSGVGVEWEIEDGTREWGGMGIGLRIWGMGDRGWGTGLRNGNGVELEMGNWDRDENQIWGTGGEEWDRGMRWRGGEGGGERIGMWEMELGDGEQGWDGMGMWGMGDRGWGMGT